MRETRTSRQIIAEIEQTLGGLPPFLEPAIPTPHVLESLWRLTLAAYVENPFSALFKERISALLSWCSDVPYDMVRHTDALSSLDLPFAQVSTWWETAEFCTSDAQSLDTLPIPRPDEAASPRLNSPLEQTLLACAAAVYLDRDGTGESRAELQRLLGEPLYVHLTSFLAYIRTCHTWSVLNPGISPQIQRRDSDEAFRQTDALLSGSDRWQSESEQRLRLALDSGHLSFYQLDISTGRFLEISNSCRTQFGLTPDAEFSLESFISMIHSDDRADIVTAIQSAVAEQRLFQAEHRIVWADGSIHWIRVHGNPVLDEETGATLMIGVCHDITDRMLSEERFRVLFKHSSQAHLVFDENGIIDCNTAALAMLHCTDKGQLLGMHPAKLSPDCQPDGRRSSEKSVEMDAIAREQGYHRFEWTHRRIDGEEFPAEVTLNPATLAGRPVLIVAWQDLTERRRAQDALRQQEEQLRAVVDQAMDGIFVFEAATDRLLTTNAALREMLGYTVEEAAHLTLHDIVAPEDETADKHLRAALRQNDAAIGEQQYKRRNGSQLSVEMRARVINYNGDEALCVVVHDITERKALESTRERTLQEALERADQDPLTGLLNHRAFYNRLEAEADRAQREGSVLAVAMLDLDNFKFFNDAYGHAMGDEVLRLVAGRLKTACRTYDTAARFGGDEFALLLPGIGYTSAAEIEARLRKDLAGLACSPEQEEVIPINLSVGVALLSDASLNCHNALQLADERLLRCKTGGSADMEADRVRKHAERSLGGFSMLDALVTAVDNKDRYTRKHSEDVMEYSLLIARELGMDAAEQHVVAVAALLHDVGKIGVPDAILRKPGKLTDAEFEAIKQHPQMGAIIVQAVPGLENTLDAVRHHHERWDGGGYPFGLWQQETPLMARLMAVADAFSAMTTDRPYRRGMDRRKALGILDAGAGTQWDPVCVSAFLQAQSEDPTRSADSEAAIQVAA